MTLTEIQLTAVYGPAVPLDQVCEAYFGLRVPEARRKAAVNDLPVPTFKLRDSQKAPLVIKSTDLAAWIDATHETALAEWKKSQV